MNIAEGGETRRRRKTRDTQGGRPGCQNKTGSDAVDLLRSFSTQTTSRVYKKEGKQFNAGQLQYVMEIALLLPEVRGQN